MRTLVKTNSKQHPVFSYLTECLPTAETIQLEYGKTVEDTIQARLQFVVDCFNSEYNFADNRKRYGNTPNVFAQWLMGLPSVFSVEYRNHAIIELAKQWGSLQDYSTELQEQRILDNWFNFAAVKFSQLCKFNNVKF